MRVWRVLARLRWRDRSWRSGRARRRRTTPIAMRIPSDAGQRSRRPTSASTCARRGDIHRVARQSDLAAAEARVTALELCSRACR